ncbi:hypothetical protein [Nocardia sp. BMG51109]|uniref:hypothetical protein n=1 Tax=Nocardia sp. BMG51109 TaxID=1056816 RepID=UPI000467C9B8|nr:hypothetical protein [Nocardia sp. BMG51109]
MTTDHSGAGAAPIPGSDAPERLPVRPLTFRESLDLPFAVLTEHIRLLGGLVGAAYLIAVGAVAALTVAGSAATGGSDAGTAWAAVLSTVVLAWLLRWYVRGVTVPAGLASLHRRPIDRRSALRDLRRAAGPLLRYRAVSTLIGLGVLALGAIFVVTVLPALVWLGWLRARRCLTVPALLDESAPSGDSAPFGQPMPYRTAATRAKTLAAGGEWRLTGVWLYLRGVLLVLIVPLVGGTLFVSEISGTHRWAAIVLSTATVLLFAALAEAVESAADVVGYADRRCRREGWDIRIPVVGNRTRAGAA